MPGFMFAPKCSEIEHRRREGGRALPTMICKPNGFDQDNKLQLPRNAQASATAQAET
jgi:hypothetical protein